MGRRGHRGRVSTDDIVTAVRRVMHAANVLPPSPVSPSSHASSSSPSSFSSPSSSESIIVSDDVVECGIRWSSRLQRVNYQTTLFTYSLMSLSNRWGGFVCDMNVPFIHAKGFFIWNNVVRRLIPPPPPTRIAVAPPTDLTMLNPNLWPHARNLPGDAALRDDDVEFWALRSRRGRGMS